MSPKDIHLLQREVAIDRSEQSYKKLFLHFYSRIFGFVNRYVGQREVAEEIVSDVMIKLWTLEDRLLNIENLNIYLYAAAKNSAINYLVKNKRYSSWDIEEMAPCHLAENDTPETAVLEEELRNKVKNAIHQLPPKCQMVYQLVRRDGLTYQEVAEIMQISKNTVDRHLNIAVRKLAKSLHSYLAAK